MSNSWKYRMSKKELKILFTLSEKLYWQEQRKSGMISPIPYAWAADGEERFIAVSMFGINSDLVKKKLQEII